MFRFLLIILLLLSVIGLPTGAFAVELMATPQAKYSLQPANASYAAGDLETALSSLRRHIIEYPDSPNLFDAYTLVGRILLDQQRNSDALFYLQRIDAEQRSAEAMLLLVDALGREQQQTEASAVLTSLGADQFSGSDLSRFYLLKVEDLLTRQQSLQALVTLHGALSQVELGDQATLFNRSQSILAQLDEIELAEVSFMFATSELNDAISLFKAQKALNNGDSEGARQIAEQLIGCARILAAKIGAATILDQVYEQPWQQRAIGVVLPLTGRYAPFGQLVKQGIELAKSALVSSPVRFIYRDSQADPLLAAQAVDELVNGDRVLTVIGPLMADGAQQSIAVAQAAQVPLLTLSHRQGLPEQGEYIFRNSLTTQQQVDVLADYAIDVLGLNTYAILSPDSRAGQEFAQKFSTAIESRGGDIVHRMTFAEQATDFRRQLLLMKGEDPDAPIDDHDKVVVQTDDELAEGEEVVVEERPDWLPTVDFEALFIPAYAENIALIAPQLAYYGIENVQLLGMNGWNSPSLIQQAGRYTRGAIFSDGFYAASAQPQVATFVENYSQRYSETPSIIEAQAYDCAMIVLSLLEQPQITTAGHMHNALLSLHSFAGVSGLQGFDERGEAERQPVLLKMGRRHLEQLDWVVVPEQDSASELLEKVDLYQTNKR